MKTKYDCKIYVNGDQYINYTKTSFTAAFKIGAEFYNRAEMNPNTKFTVFNIVYSDEVDELLEIVFKNDLANYYHNNSAAHKLIKKYLPQINLKAKCNNK